MKKFNQFINEGVRDKMTPKSEDDIKKSLEGLSPKEKIEKAVKYNIIWAAQEAIDEGVDITGHTNSGYHFGQRLLDDSVIKGHVDMTKFLIKNGVVLRKSDLADSLENAVSNNRLEMVKFLIEEGAPTYNEYSEINMVETALANNNIEILEVLLDNTDQINDPTYIDVNWFKQEIENGNIKSDTIKVITSKVPAIKKVIEEMITIYEKTLEVLNKCL